MTDTEANEQITALYWQFIAGQAHRGLRKAEARLAALPKPEELILYPKVKSSHVPERKRRAAESVMDLLYNQHPGLKRAALCWFTDADAEDTRLWAKYQQRNEPYPFEALYDSRDLLGQCDRGLGQLWIKATLDGAQLVEVAAHEAYHHICESGSESDALAFGRKAASLLCPHGRGALFFTESNRYNAKAGDSILVPHGSKSWIRILGHDGSMEWHRPPEQYELFVASGTNTYQA